MASARLVGLDVARCVALLGMVATHVLDERTPAGDLTTAQVLAGGRAAALFALLAGVTLALSTGGRTPVRGRERVAASVGLLVRALSIAVIGLLLGGLETGLAIILTYYGLLFCLGIPFVGLGAGGLAALAGGWLVAAPVVSHLLRPELPPRGFGSPTFQQLFTEPLRMLSELAFTGYYPVVPWLAYLLAGMALGRADLRSRRVQAGLAMVGAGLALGAALLSRALTALPSVGEALRAQPPTRASVPDLLDRASEGMAGTTPTGGAWQWLLVDAPHSATPFDLAQTTGSAVLVIGVALLVVGVLPAVGERFTAVLFGAGTMTLTLYSLHALMKTPQVWPAEVPEAFTSHVLVLGAIGAVYVALRIRGPLERIVGALSGGARSLVRGG